MLRGGIEKDYDGVDHLKDEQTAVQRGQLRRLQRLCKTHAKQLKFDQYDTYEYNNDESGDDEDEDEDEDEDSEDEDEEDY